MEIPQRAKTEKQEDGGYHLVTDGTSWVHVKYPLVSLKQIEKTTKRWKHCSGWGEEDTAVGGEIQVDEEHKKYYVNISLPSDERNFWLWVSCYLSQFLIVAIYTLERAHS